MQRPRGDNQQRILEFIKSEISTKGYPPSVREIANAVGLKSTSTVHGHLQRLEKRGLLHRDAMKPRAMEITAEGESEHTSTMAVPLLGNVTAGQPILAEENTGDPSLPRAGLATPIPVVGHVTAGQPILAEENLDEYIALPDMLLGDGEHFVLKVHGDSMIEAGILDGDHIIVRRQQEANNGEIVVAMIDDSATVKRYYKENGHYRLQPENHEMAPIIVDHVTILGKVVSLYRVIR